eukprot:scaffold255472_cov13-Prasinocladus_malaysianus.AAC.1
MLLTTVVIDTGVATGRRRTVTVNVIVVVAVGEVSVANAKTLYSRCTSTHHAAADPPTEATIVDAGPRGMYAACCVPFPTTWKQNLPNLAYSSKTQHAARTARLSLSYSGSDAAQAALSLMKRYYGSSAQRLL